MRTLVIVVTTALLLMSGPLSAQQASVPLAPLTAPASPARSVSAFQFTGNNLFGDEALREIVESYQGQTVDQLQLAEIADRIALFYHDHGYIARAAASEEGGAVTVKVTESKLEELTIEGNKRYSDRFIRSYLSGLKPGEVWSQADLERSLLLLRDLGLGVGAVLSEGEEPGMTRIRVEVTYEPPALSASLAVDNFGAPEVSRERITEIVSYENPAKQGDSVTLQLIHGFNPDDVLFGHLRYYIPIGTDGTRLSAYVGAGDFGVGGPFGALGLAGQGTFYGLSAQHPLWLSRRGSLRAEVGADAYDSDFKMQGVTPALSSDRIRKVRLGAAFDALDKAGKSRNMASLYIHQGLGSALGGMADNDPRSSRHLAGADGQFTKFTVEAARLQRLSDQATVMVRLSAQESTEALVVGEQMLIGGPDSVRGYPQSAALGDSGIQANVEFRYTPDFPSKPGWLNEVQGVAFVDHGTISRKNPQTGEEPSVSLTGVGVGFRATLLDGELSVRTDLGYGLTETTDVEGGFQPYFEVKKTFTF